MKTNRQLLIIFLLFGMLASSCSFNGLKRNILESHHVLEANDEFEVIWNKTGFDLYTSERRSMIVSSPGKIIVEGWGASNTLSLFALDSLTGDTIWRTPFNSDMPGYIISQDPVIYRGTFGASDIQAYNASDGKLIWKTNLPLAHSTSEIYTANNKIFVFTSDNMFFILDKEGKILDTHHETFTTYLEMDNVLYFDENISLKAVDVMTRKELWQVKIDDRFTHSPIFDKGTIFLRTWTIPGYVYSIDQITGKINWKVSQDVLSNLAISENKIYFIDFDGYLLALDRYSGNETAKIKFSSEFDLTKGVDSYFISIDPQNDVLAAYFGDNSQMLGIKILNP